MKLLKFILINALPIILMIALIPLVKNDYILAAIYLAVIGISLFIHYQKFEFSILIFGLVMLTISEYFFVRTGVEEFQRITLFSVMPIWLPVLWGYSFIAIKRVVIKLQS